jgi:hypothetical protein
MITKDAGSLASALATNVEYVITSLPSADPKDPNLTADGGPIYYFPTEQPNGVKFRAYYPYNAAVSNVTNNHTYPVNVGDQSTLAKQKALDLMWCEGAKDEPIKSATDVVGLKEFTHKLSKLKISVDRGNTTVDLTKSPVLTIRGMPTTANCNLYDGAIGSLGGNTVTITPVTKGAATEAKAEWEAFIIPHTDADADANGRKFTIEADGVTFIYDLPTGTTFATGALYEYKFTLTPNYDGESNCYMVKPGEVKIFDVSRAYEYDGKQFTDNLRVDGSSYNGTDDVFTTELVWADEDVIADHSIVPDTKGKTSRVKVGTKSGVSGNAVIAIKDKEGNRCWSYHIWVSNYNPDDATALEQDTYTNTYNKNNNGKHFVFMDRNLGAPFAGTGSGESTGLFYQWGRKDPFPATSNPGDLLCKFTVELTDDMKGTIANTIRNPGVFYGSTQQPHDWLYSDHDSELWGHSGRKTIYDPCPQGWRVPKNYGLSNVTSPWYGFTVSNGTWNSGYTWDTNARYPAKGGRDTYGFLSGVGINVGCWSASIDDALPSYIGILWCHEGSVELHDANSRASEGPVRCVRE